MPDPSSLPTRVGHMRWGEHRFRGHDAFAELAGRTSWWSLVSLAVEGPEIDEGAAAVLDMLCCCCTAADPRIPPLKATRLATAYGSALFGFGGTYLLLSDAQFGPYSCGPAGELLVSCASVAGTPLDTTAVADHLREAFGRARRLAGLGVPARRSDERVEAIGRHLRAMRRVGPHWRLLEVIEREACSLQPGSTANLAIAIAAVLLDLGFRVDQLSLVGFYVVLPAITANAYEGAHQAPAILRRLPRDAVEYHGPGPRPSPRALAADPDA